MLMQFDFVSRVLKKKKGEPQRRCWNCLHWDRAFPGAEWAPCSFHSLLVENMREGEAVRLLRTNRLDVCEDHYCERDAEVVNVRE